MVRISLKAERGRPRSCQLLFLQVNSFDHRVENRSVVTLSATTADLSAERSLSIRHQAGICRRKLWLCFHMHTVTPHRIICKVQSERLKQSSFELFALFYLLMILKYHQQAPCSDFHCSRFMVLAEMLLYYYWYILEMTSETTHCCCNQTHHFPLVWLKAALPGCFQETNSKIKQPVSPLCSHHLHNNRRRGRGF